MRLKVTLLLDLKDKGSAATVQQQLHNCADQIEQVKSVDQCFAHWSSLGRKKESPLWKKN